MSDNQQPQSTKEGAGGSSPTTPLMQSAALAAAQHLPVALAAKAGRTNAGCDFLPMGLIAHLNSGGGDSGTVGTPEQHAQVALLPKVIREMERLQQEGSLSPSSEDASLRRALDVLQSLLHGDGDKIALTKEVMHPLFPHARVLRLVNYGSFGGPPIPVTVCQSAYQQHVVDGDSERTMLRQLFGLVEDVHRIVASYMGLTTSDDIVLVDNAAEGFNVVAESLIFNPAFYSEVKKQKPSDGERPAPLKIMLMSNVYPMVANCVQYWVNRQAQLAKALGPVAAQHLWDYEVVRCILTPHMVASVNAAGADGSPDALIDGIVANAVDQAADVVVFDHVAFAPALVLPINEIARRIKAVRPSTLVVIDAAHAIGAVPLEETFADPQFDAWFSNCHKWLMAPKHSAVLWFAPKWRGFMHPSVKSNLYRGTPFATSDEEQARQADCLLRLSNGLRFPNVSDAARRRAEFYWRGTRDITGVLCLADVIWFRRQLGDARIIAHNRKLALEAATAMARVWGTDLLVHNPRFLPPMAVVRLPTDDTDAVRRAADMLSEQYASHFPTLTFDGHMYCRISAQVVNDVTDYEEVARRFLSCLPPG